MLQEVANSRDRTVLCGDEEMSWDTFCSLERRIQKAQEEGNWRTFLTPSIMPSTFLNLTSDAQTPERGIAGLPARKGILETIIAAHIMKATDARDKLFAMLQFGDDNSAHVNMDLDLQDPRIRPDYYKPPTTVFCDFVRWWIDKHKSLRILSAVHTLRNRGWQQTYYGEPIKVSTMTYPTWSINLADGGDSDWAKATLSLDLETSYKASGSTEPNVLVNDVHNVHALQIAGHRICTIQEIMPFPYWHPQDLGRAWIELRKVFSQILDPTALRRSRKFSHDYVPELQENSATYQAEELLESDARHYTCHRRGFSPDSQVSLPCISPCRFIAEGTLHEASARHGLCPHNARPGDVVVMLFGGAVLYLLRQKDEPDSETDTEASNAAQQRSQEYYFVGECYLHGYKCGQALEEANEAFAAGQEPEIFNLV